MFRRTCLFSLLLTLGNIVADSYGMRELCGGVDVSKDPRIEARQLDGMWHSQGTITSQFPSISFISFENQGKALWLNDWNSTTRTCSFRKINSQLQSIEHGPFNPCFSFQQVLPVESPVYDTFVYHPTKNLLMYYACFANVGPNGRCSQSPFVRVLTRTLGISRKEKQLVDWRLRELGESINSITFANPSENGCPRPMQKKGRSRY